MSPEKNLLIKLSKSLGIDKIKKHILLCVPTEAKCVSKKKCNESWNYLKTRLKELKLVGDGGVYRTKADCLRICQEGPIAVVYPDGIWYHSCSPEVIERIIQEHLIKKKPVKDYMITKKKSKFSFDI